MLLGAGAGVAPDLDFLPGLIIGDPSRFHHAVTHTIVAAIAAGALATLAASADRARWGALIGLSYATHLLLDFLTLDDSPPRGIPLLWPLTSRVFLSASPPFDRVVHSGGGPLFGAHNFAVATRELLVLLPILVIVAIWARSRFAASRPSTSPPSVRGRR